MADSTIGAAIEAPNPFMRERAMALDAREVVALDADHHPIHMVTSIDFEGQRLFFQGMQAVQGHRLFRRELR